MAKKLTYVSAMAMMLAFTPKIKAANPGDFEVTPIGGIRFVDVKMIQNTTNIQKIITYTLDPADADAVEFDTRMTWIAADNDLYDWAYDATRDTEEYVMAELDTSEKTITFTCYKPFGRRMKFDMIYRNNPSIAAALVLDYERKVTADATVTLSAEAFKDGEALKVTPTSAEYSIGTKGIREDDIRVDIAMDESKKTIKEMIGTPKIPAGAYSQKFRYKGTDYTNAAQMVTVMESSVKSYLLSCVNQETEVVFRESELKDILAFQYITYHDYMDHYGTSYATYIEFVKNYKEASLNGSGVRVKVSFNGEVKLNQIILLNIALNQLDRIDLSDAEITF